MASFKTCRLCDCSQELHDVLVAGRSGCIRRIDKFLHLESHKVAGCLQEGDFLEIVTSTERCVCHFFHADFERCKIMNQHLALLAKKYFGTRFIRLSAPVSPLPICSIGGCNV